MSTGKNMILVGTHLPVLVRAFELSEGDVLELGTGFFSTNILRWLCEMSGRTLYSYETDMYWYNRAIRKPTSFQTDGDSDTEALMLTDGDLESDTDKVFKVDSFDEIDLSCKHWGLALIDQHPTSRRIVDIKRLVNLVDYIVIHDTNPEYEDYRHGRRKGYRYSEIWPLFKYRYDFTKYNPNTSVVSNFFPLERFK